MDPKYQYFMFKSSSTYETNAPVEFFVQELHKETLSNGTGRFLYVSAIHSSGSVYQVNMEMVKFLPGYRCTFYPSLTGNYVAVLYEDGIDLRNSPKTIGCPLYITVNRNYKFFSQTPVVESFIVAGATGAKFWGVTADKFSDALFITDREAHEVICLHPSAAQGQPLFRYGNFSPASKEALYRPTGLACDAFHKRLVICDKDHHRVVFISLDGQFLSSFGKKGHQNGEFNYPWDVDVSSDGDLIVVSDSRNHRLQLFDQFGNFLRKFSIFEQQPFEYKQEFDYPRGVTFDLDGSTVFVTDFNTHNVLAINVQMTEMRKMVPPGKMLRPQGIAIDAAGNLLVCDSRKNCIRIMNRTGDLLSTVDRIGKYHLTVPADVAVMARGEVCLIDVFGRIRIF